MLIAFGQARSKLSKAWLSPDAELAIKPGEADVIAFIHRYSDEHHGVNPSQIGDSLGMSRPAVTAVLNSLQEKGCIERRLSTADRRRFEIFLTPDSRKQVDDMICRMDSYVKRIVQELGEEDAAQLVRLMTRVLKILASDPPCKESKKKQST